MRTLVDFHIPEATSRLMLPIIETRGKLEAAEKNANALDVFVDENCFEIPGAHIKLTDFTDRFIDSLEDHMKSDWQEWMKIQSKLSERFLVGKSRKINQNIIGNLTFNSKLKASDPYIKVGKYIRKENEDD
jgi:hypothetical protein